MTNEEALSCIGTIRFLQNYFFSNHGVFTDRELEDIETVIKKLKQTSWIPVSERLPNAYEFVNCTCHSLIDDREDWVIETVYIPQPSYSPYSDWGNIPMLNSGDCKVVAWMHRDIPEPYKAESEKSE